MEPNQEWQNRLGVVSGVLLDVLQFVGGDFVRDKNRVGRAYRDAGATIDAAIRVNVKLGCRFEGLVIFLGVNAIGWASFDAEFIFGTGIGDYVCHECDLRSGMINWGRDAA
jgi:hypothetical protein